MKWMKKYTNEWNEKFIGPRLLDLPGRPIGGQLCSQSQKQPPQLNKHSRSLLLEVFFHHVRRPFNLFLRYASSRSIGKESCWVAYHRLADREVKSPFLQQFIPGTPHFRLVAVWAAVWYILSYLNWVLTASSRFLMTEHYYSTPFTHYIHHEFKQALI